MTVSMEGLFWSVIGELRYQPTLKRVRADLGGAPVVDTTGAVLIWEPTRVVPSYAVPESDVVATLVPEASPVAPAAHRRLGFGDDGPPILDPSIPFAVHTAPGEPLDVVTDHGTRAGAAFRLVDGDVAGLVVLDFDAFDWREEDEAIMGHARDPFHRIDVRRSTRTVRIELDGVVLAESREPRVLFEAVFPLPRFYLPRRDVRVELRPGSLRTVCAYKGVATHWSPVVGERVVEDLAWSYEDPLDDALAVQSLVCFYQERLDVFVDGEPVGRVRTPWS